MDPHRPVDLADGLTLAAARLKCDTVPPTLGDFPAETPRAARLRAVDGGAAGPDVVVDPVVGEPVVVAIGDARRSVTQARVRLEALRAEIVELWPDGGGGELPPAA
jgi:hypothetical protein